MKPKSLSSFQSTRWGHRPIVKKSQLEASLTKSIKRFLADHPDYMKRLAEMFVKCAVGEVDEKTANILSRVRGIDHFRELFNRLDGPVIQKIDSTIRSDKTVILHDGPAVPFALKPKEEEGGNSAGVAS